MVENNIDPNSINFIYGYAGLQGSGVIEISPLLNKPGSQENKGSKEQLFNAK